MYDALDRYVAMISKEISESQSDLLRDFEEKLSKIRSLSIRARKLHIRQNSPNIDLELFKKNIFSKRKKGKVPME